MSITIYKVIDSVTLEFVYKDRVERVKLKTMSIMELSQKTFLTQSLDKDVSVLKSIKKIEDISRFLSRNLVSWEISYDGNRIGTSYDDVLFVVKHCPDYVFMVLREYYKIMLSFRDFEINSFYTERSARKESTQKKTFLQHVSLFLKDFTFWFSITIIAVAVIQVFINFQPAI